MRLASEAIRQVHDRLHAGCILWCQSGRSFPFENRLLAQTPKWDRYLGAFNVIRIVLTNFVESGITINDLLSNLTEELIEEFKDAYPTVRFSKRPLL